MSGPGTSRFRDTLCEDVEEAAPRVGCGCRNCYRTREMSLDPRLIALARDPIGQSLSAIGYMAQHHLHQHLTAYCMGRLDYGALHLGIIRSLMKLAGDLQEQVLTTARITPALTRFPAPAVKP
jgi:hypothetical protein